MNAPAKMTPKYPKVYILYPRGVVTGGPTSLHLLAQEIRGLGGEAYLVPWRRTETRPRAKAYDELGIPEGEILDSTDNLVVTSEFSFVDLAGLKKANIAVWWLSFENSVPYFVHRLRNPRLAGSIRLRILRKKIRSGEYWRYLRATWLRRNRAIHFSNSRHAQVQLEKRLGLTARMLAAPARIAAPSGQIPRQARWISYNPAKGGEKRIRYLSSRRTDLTFVPLSGMSPPEVAETLNASALYLDLGYFPGKDRLPREAALLGVPVIVADVGAARFDEDYLLRSWQRIDVKQDGWEEAALASIDFVLENPEQAMKEQLPFAQQVANEAALFTQQVVDYFFTR